MDEPTDKPVVEVLEYRSSLTANTRKARRSVLDLLCSGIIGLLLVAVGLVLALVMFYSVAANIRDGHWVVATVLVPFVVFGGLMGMAGFALILGWGDHGGRR
jgi:tetrahydromethanopterin S-methyltransferase subunit F